MKYFRIIILNILLVSQFCFASSAVKIKQVQGDVKVRQGLEEVWHPAGQGLILKTIDTILTGEKALVTLELEEGLTFKLGSNAILDVGDLRKITEQELFLYLTSQKVGRIQAPKQGSLHIENVSVVRGSRVGSDSEDRTMAYTKNYQLELNGAKALQSQAYFANAIVKLYKIKQKYPTVKTHGEIDFCLAQAFEQVGQSGRAVDAYREAVVCAEKDPDANSTRIKQLSTEAISRLKVQ